MERRVLCLGVLLFCIAVSEALFGVRSQDGVDYALVFPKKIRFGTASTVVVTATGLGHKSAFLDLRLSLDSAVLLQTRLHFTKESMQTWQVVVTPDMVPPGTRSVTLQAGGESAKVDLDPGTGHVFIQLDKSLYQPKQHVKYRILALDEDMRWAGWPVKVEIKTPDDVLLDSATYGSEEAFTGKQFYLPKHAVLGRWQITATFTNTGQITTSATAFFEVGEYVLPGFSVSLTSSYGLVLPLNEFFTATVSARYTYDKPVEGTAYVRIGVVREKDIALFDKKYEVPLDEAGKAKLIFRTEELRGWSLWFPEGRRLYLKATVVDHSTGEAREATNQSILFSSTVYKVNVDRTRKLYKPGLPHKVEVYITRLNGERAGGINVFFLIMRDGSTEFKFLTTDMNGYVSYVMETSPQPVKISISVRTLDPYVWVQTTEDFELTPYEALGEQSVTVEADQVYEGSGLDLTLVYKPHLNFIRPNALIHVLVVSGGRIVYTDSVRMSIAGRHQLSLPAHLVSEWSPRIRVVALHVDDANPQRHQAVVVADSTLVDLPRTCRHELTLSYPDGETTYVREPKQEAEMEINGAPGMRVGLVAVDKALYALNNERSLTRETIFKSLEQHDLGNGTGEGKDAKEVLEKAGLHMLAFRASPRTADYDLSRPLFSGMYPDRPFSTLPESSDPEPDVLETIPLEEVRKDFPEAWLFQEQVLNGSGQGHVNFRLPDVITTWVMHAVGVAPSGGACVSNSLDYVTFKPFFVKVTLPFKAVRLEEVTVEVTIRSYHPHNMRVRLHVSGDDGLCFTGSRRRNSNVFSRRLQIPAGGARHYRFSVIPLRVGSLNLTVSALAIEIRTRDTVVKPLYVVAEGRRIHKAWTFALDPEGKQLPYLEDHEVSHSQSPSIQRQMDRGAKRQLTQIDLALPSEVIPDSGHCKIAAFGDLMGDVIYHAILQSEPEAGGELLGAEDVLGTLAPVVYALHYLNSSGLLTQDIAFDAREQIKTGITNLMKYRTIDFAYTETPASLLSTGSVWLTAEVVKTLCHARELTYVNSLIIDYGISWLLAKVKDGRVVETEVNAYTNTRDRGAILNAEVLITLFECKYAQTQAADTVLALLEALLEDFMVRSSDTPSVLVLAKTAYAFQLSGNMWAPHILARLDDWATRTSDNLVYWSDFILDTQRQETLPYWYRSGADATSIEATAYALLAHLESPAATTTTAPVAEWLIRQRGDVGIFIGALDTAAATRALAAYSLSKETAETHLHCNISTEPMANYSHTLEFTAEDAMVQKALLDVPIGRKLNVTASGKGLGQMQVSVGYHVPVRPNENCRFNLTVERQPAFPRYMTVDPQEHPLCMFCGYDCPDGVTSDPPHRQRRSIGYSKTALCVRVCLGHLGEEYAGKTMLDIGVLNGYEPIIEDIKSFTNQLPNVIAAEHDVNKGTIRVALREVPNNETLCLAFRAKDMEEVAFQKPALVTVREARWRDDSCVTSYEPAENSVTVQTLCANTNQGYKALCKCVSGRCPTCGPTFGEHYGIAKLQREICAAAYAYEVQVEEEYEEEGWKETVHKVVQVGRMTDLHKVRVGERVVVVSQESCPCPRHRPGERHWIVGKEIIRFKNKDGEDIYKYPVDETSLFLNVSEREQRGRSISRLHLEAALLNARERC